MKTILAVLAMAAALQAAYAGGVAPRNGDYLSEPYLAALEKTRSHYQAWKSAGMDAPQAMRVSRDKRGLVFDLVINWHEGTAAVFNPQNPTVNLYPEGGVNEPFVWRDATHFQFGTGKDRTLYRYIGDEQTFLRNTLLGGTYADAKGLRYVFGADGVARFPDRTFHYEIYTDMVFEEGDEFVDRDASKPNAWKTYGFERKGDRLTLFKLDCPDTAPGCTPDRKRPLAVLRKLAAP